jgi:hypothetical protein
MDKAGNVHHQMSPWSYESFPDQERRISLLKKNAGITVQRIMQNILSSTKGHADQRSSKQ